MNILPDVGIENLKVVENLVSDPPGKFVYRGGQPGDKGFQWLKEQGVTDIVKVNTEGEGTDIAAEALGIKVAYFPIPLMDQLIFKPNKQEVVNAVNAIAVPFQDPTNVFVHCEHGQDRTGLIIGCFRVWQQGWTKHDAWKEMLDNGFHLDLPGLVLFWEWAV